MLLVCKRRRWCLALQVGSLLLVGMGLFCGSCYAYALTGNPSVKYGAPFGGTVLILAWLCVLL